MITIPTFNYVGPRPVLIPQEGNPTNTYTGRKGVYSNWALFSKTHVLDKTPDEPHTPGTGYHPGDVYMTQIYLGLGHYVQELHAPGLGVRQDPTYFRTQPLLYHGLAGAKVFPVGYGHVEAGGPMAEYATNRINVKFQGVPSAKALTTILIGHKSRSYGDPGVPSGFGAIHPFIYQGVPGAFIPDTGHPYWPPSVVPDALADYGKVPAPTAAQHYGQEHVLEWAGVPSSKALGVTGTPPAVTGLPPHP